MTESTFTTRKPKETFYVNGHKVTVQAFILPHQKKMTAEEFQLNAGIHGWNAQQGFYVYRNNRLIVAGDWLIPGLEKLEQYRLARIRIDIGNEMDTEWSIDVKKSTAIPPIEIQSEIKRIALLARKESAKIFRHRGKTLARKKQKEQHYVWQQKIRNGKLGYSINKEHPLIKTALKNDQDGQLKQLLKLIEETIPVPMIIADNAEREEQLRDPYENTSPGEMNKLLEGLFGYYCETGLSREEAIESIANTEPFVYAPDLIALFCEKEGITID